MESIRRIESTTCYGRSFALGETKILFVERSDEVDYEMNGRILSPHPKKERKKKREKRTTDASRKAKGVDSTWNEDREKHEDREKGSTRLIRADLTMIRTTSRR